MGQYSDLFNDMPTPPANPGTAVQLTADAVPQQEVKYKDLAARYKVPVDVVRTFPKDYEVKAKVDDVDSATANAPHLRSWLADTRNTPLVDTKDVGVLSTLETALANTGKAILSAGPKFNEGAWGVARAGAELLPDIVGLPAAELFAKYGGIQRSTANELMPKAESILGAGWYSGMQSLGLNILQMPLGIGGKLAPVLASMGLSTGGQAYGEARDAGVGIPKALMFGASQGVIEAGTEMMGLPAALGMFKPGQFGAKAMEYLWKDQVGEQIATHLQDLNEWAVLHPEKTLQDYIDERPDAALQTALATAFGGGGQVVLSKVVQKGLQIAAKDHGQERAQANADQLSQMLALAAQAQLREQSPQTFAEVSQHLAEQTEGAPTEVRFDARTLGEVLNQDEIAMLPSVASQMQEALATGGEVRVPIGELLANVAGTPVEKKLTEHARIGDADMSQAEAKEAQAQAETYLQDEAKRVISEATDTVAAQASADKVKANVHSQLTTLARFTSDVNGAYATVAANMYTALASRLGVTAEEAYDRYPLKINGVNPATQGEVLNSRPGALSVEGYHYSKAERPIISGHAFGSGLKGSNQDMYANAEDKRLRNRSYFYVDTGTGITPEAGVGGIGHRAQLNNIYDANTDPLRLRKGGQLAFESAVLDNGFDGYLDRLSGAQPGQVVVLNGKMVDAEVLGPTGKTKGKVVPAVGTRESIGRDQVVDRVTANNALPSGAPTLARWAELLPAEDYAAMKQAGVFDGDLTKTMYKSELVKAFESKTEDPVYGQRDREGSRAIGSDTPLPGAPKIEGASGPDQRLVDVAETYAASVGIDLRRQSEYVKVDPERAARIAQAYEDMKHAPQDPEVKAAYADLIKQTLAQYKALEDAGYKFTFFDSSTDPYKGNPWNAMRDLRANQTMAVYGTYDGYGTEGVTQGATEDNPMLADTGLQWPDQGGVMHPVLANDLFRAVHDAFGHGFEGAGFRADGEENAWQAHVRLFTGPAVAAITTETRGQNSWLNYGPHGESNRNAKVEDTVFADQKTGLMPAWTWEEGRAGDMPEAVYEQSDPKKIAGLARIEKNLTPAERNKLNKGTAQRLVDLFKGLPPTDQFVAAAWAGRAKRGWYKESALAIGQVFGPDAPRFAGLLAAMSPQNSVETNLLNTLNTWKNWVAAGRPTSREDIVQIMGRSVEGTGGVSSVLDAWINNSVRALTTENPGQDLLSGPKVDSFMRNLLNDVEQVTNDAWMANFAFVDQKMFKGGLNATDAGKGPGYLAMSAKVREAAKVLTEKTGEQWTPAEVQETIWSWAKTLYEAQEADISASDILYNEQLTHEMIRATPDFKGLFHDEKYEKILRDAGYGSQLDALDPGSAGREVAGLSEQAGPFDSATQYKHELASAKRLEDLKRYGKPDSAKVYEQADNKYQSKYLAGRDVAALNPEERAQYDALATPEVLNAPGARGTFNPKTLTISLLERANLSTFHHEMAHFYLETLIDVASGPNAPAPIVSDVNTLMSWFGVKDLATWNGMSFEAKRASHEKFAEHYERYLFEGQSPNQEMQTLFRRFSTWMKDVYKNVKDWMEGMGKTLTPEVRGVYDRMLATDAQIEEAEHVRNYAPLFKSADQAGMTPEAWTIYQLQAQDATETAMENLQTRSLRDMKLTVNAQSRALKALTKDAAEKRKAIEAEVKMEVASLPVYEAKAYLDAAHKPTAEDKAASAAHKALRDAAAAKALEDAKAALPGFAEVKGLEKAQLVAKSKRELTNTVDREMIAWDRANPKPEKTNSETDLQVASEMFGYSSPDEMLRAIREAEPFAGVVDGMTDQRMLERYGDLATPEALTNAANAAVHNEARARFVATELKALNEGMRLTPPSRLSILEKLKECLG